MASSVSIEFPLTRMSDYCYEASRRILDDPDDESDGEPSCEGDCQRCPE